MDACADFKVLDSRIGGGLDLHLVGENWDDAAPGVTYPIMRRGLTIGVTPSPGRAPPRRASQGSGAAVEKLELEKT